jgi:hypothetical protein
MSVGGVPVTVDSSGVHVAGNGTPVDTDTVNSTLANLGMRIVLSGPTETRNGATVSYDSGSLVLFWDPSPDESLTVRVGGARVTAGASAADPAVTGPTGTTTDTAPAPGSGTGALGVPPAVPAQVTGAAAPQAQPVTPVVLAAETAPRGALVLAALGALALLVALLRFPSAVVDLPAGPACAPRSPS